MSLSKGKNWTSTVIIGLFYVVLTIISFLGANHAADPTDISRLRSELLRDYDKTARPVFNHKDVVYVNFYLEPKGFEFDERKSKFTLYAWTYLSWNDDHMSWNPLMYGNISYIHFIANELWLPDIFVYNNLDKSEIDHFGNTRMIIYSYSWVVWVPPSKFVVGCNSDLRNWPVDTQTCKIVIGSWMHDGNQLDLIVPANKSSHYLGTMQVNQEWDLIDSYYYKNVTHYDCCPGEPYPDIVNVFTLQRRGFNHKAGVVVPGLVLAICILIAFWIQPGATERLFLILIVILTNGMCLNYIYSVLPNNGDNVPLILLYYRNTLMMGSVALLWTVCLRYLADTKRTSPVPLPGFISGFLGSLPGKILCLEPRPMSIGGVLETARVSGNANGNEDEVEVEVTSDSGKLVGSVNPFQEDWAWLAHLLDRIAFVVYLVIYLCFYVQLL